MNAIFHVDNEYKEQAESAGFDVNQPSQSDPNCFIVTVKNVDPNALKVFTDWGDLASHYGLLYESIIYTQIQKS
jgi:hypothetical protein